MREVKFRREGEGLKVGGKGGSDYNAPSRAHSVKGCVQWYSVYLLISVLSHQCMPCVFSTVLLVRTYMLS